MGYAFYMAALAYSLRAGVFSMVFADALARPHAAKGG